MIACVYRASKTNVGDKACCPADYFDFGTVSRVDVAHFADDESRQILNDADYILLGGGGVFYFEQSVSALVDAHGEKTIVWGAGANQHGSTTLTYPDNLWKCAIVGLRDVGDFWVPCVSCLSPLFDRYGCERGAERDVVVYEHKRFPILSDRLEWPRLKNNASLDEALQFIASGRIVVTNSYHGAYWATLLGRRCIVHQPFSSKFFGMKWQPPISYSFEELQGLLNSTGHDYEGSFLRLCRERTNGFHQQVVTLLAPHS